MLELKPYWIKGAMYFTKEACERICQVIDRRRGTKETPVKVYKEEDILPVLRLAREVATQCINFQPNYSDSAHELLAVLDATKGVEG